MLHLIIRATTDKNHTRSASFGQPENRDSIARMRWLCLLAASAASTFAPLLFAQLAPPNDAGVSMGHIHLTVPDPDAQRKVWVDVLGATETKDGLLKLPGVF